jgi:hypothetical protein
MLVVSVWLLTFLLEVLKVYVYIVLMLLAVWVVRVVSVV